MLVHRRVSGCLYFSICFYILCFLNIIDSLFDGIDSYGRSF